MIWLEPAELMLLAIGASLAALAWRRGLKDRTPAGPVFFTIITLGLFLRVVAALMEPGPLAIWTHIAGLVTLMSFPLLLLGLATEFQRLPRRLWIGFAVGVGLVVVVDLVRLVIVDEPAVLVWSLRGAYAAILMAALVFAGSAFWGTVRRGHGMTRRRAVLAVAASMALGIGVGIALPNRFLSGAPLTWPVASFLAAAILLYYAAFTPPRWLLREWRAQEVQAFVRDLRGRPLDVRPAVAGRLLARAADRLMDHCMATVLVHTAHGIEVVGWRQGASDAIAAHLDAAAMLSQEPRSTVIERRSHLEERHAELLASFHTDCLAVVPVTGSTGRHGSVAMRFDRRPPFLRQTLRVIEALAEHVAQAADLDLAVAERAQMELESLRREKAALERANRAKDMFLANMSHELRTPMNSILGFAELMASGRVGPIEKATKAHLQAVIASAKQLQRMIDNILDLTRVEADTMDFERRPVSVLAIVQEVVQALAPEATAKGHSIRLLIDPDAENVELDPARLRQVLHVYLENAIKFTPAGGNLHVEAFPREGSLRILVRDDGDGLSETEQERVFEAFEQLDSGTAKTHQGMGLGLAIAKEVVEAQGGHVGVSSQPGEGSTFYADLPLVPKAGTDPK